MTAPAGAVAIDPNDPPASTILEIGRAAPRLTGTTLDGAAFDTSAQDGPLVVYFWATWCEPCFGTRLTELQTIAARYASSVATVSVATQDELDAVWDHLDANGIRLPVINDSGSMAKAWGLTGFPVLVMLDPGGAVSAIHAGPVSGPELEQMYTALAAGEPVPTPAASHVPSSAAPPT